MAITNDQNLVLKIVAGLFNAAPGKSNFDALSSSLTSGSTPLQIAEALDSVPAFASTALGSATTTQAKVDALMSNFGLSVAGDLNPNSAASQAYAYFTQAINAGQSLGSIVHTAVTFLSGSVPAEFATTATLLSNKAAVAEHYSVTQGVSGATLADLQTILSGVTATTDVSTPAALDAVIAKVTDSTAPVATAATFSFAENATTATVLGTVTATDNAAVTGFEIVSGNDSKFFAIDSAGKITLTEAGTKSAANDFETTPNTFTIGVKAVDAAGNKSEAVNTILSVTDVDDVAPAFVGATAATGSNKVTVNFGEALKAGNPAATAFTVKDGTTTVGVTAAAVNGSAVTLTLASNVAGTITVSYDSANAVNKLQDAAGNLTANFDGKTASSDVTAPTLSTSTPSDGGTLGKADNIVLTFSEDVVLGSGGNITIVNSGDSKDTRTIAVNDASQVTVSGTKVTINPTADLVESGAYYINIPSGAISDKAGNAYAGISDATTLNFTGAAASVTPVAGQTFTLTTSVDSITGTSGNDTIIGISGTGATTSAADSVDGGTGTDTLKLFTDGTIILPGAITSIEHLFINDSTAHESRDLTVSALASGGVTQLTVQNGTTINAATVTVTMGAGQSTLTLDGITDADTTAATVADGGIAWTTLATSATVAGTATLNLNLNNVGAATLNTALSVGVTTAAATTLNVTSTGTNHINLLNAGAGLTTLNLAGAGALTDYTALTTGITTINAASATGNLSLDVSGVSARNITGGTGADTFTFGANYIGAEATVASGTRDVVNGGAGNDTISMTVARVDAADAANQENLTSIENLTISDAWTTGLNLDVTKFTTVTNVNLNGATGTSTMNLSSGSSVTLAADTGGGTTTFAVGGAGIADSLTLNMAGFDFDTSGTDSFTGVETLNINSGAVVTGAAVFANALTLTPSAGGTGNIVATGANALTFTGVVTAASIDASALTGILTVTAAAANAITIKGGTKADVINGSASNDHITGNDGADAITGAAGNDTIVLTETTSAIDKVTFTGGATTAAVVTANGSDVITGFVSNDTINVGGLGDGTTTATGLTTVSAAAAQAALVDDTVVILNVAGTAAALTTAGTAVVTDFTNLTQVAAFLSERYTTTNDAAQENVIVWNIGTTTYVYHIDTLVAEGSTAIGATEIALVGTISQSAALTTANIVYA